MNLINVYNEIAPLKKVLLHRPGNELLNLTPDKLEDLLFDDIPYLSVAQNEHDNFANILRENGVEVVYLEDLMSEVLTCNPDIKHSFLKQFILEAGISNKKYTDLILEYLSSIQDCKKLVLKTMEGINLSEVLKNGHRPSLVDFLSKSNSMIIEPMPNLYFTRDPFASVGDGVVLNKMYSTTRSRETIYAEYIFKYHKEYALNVEMLYDRKNDFSIEGGDILNLNETTLAVGISQRTTPDAIELLANNLFFNSNSKIDTVLAFDIPISRAFMHLDTVFTQIDYDKFTEHPSILGSLRVFELTKDNKNIKIRQIDGKLEEILAKYLNIPKVELILCGGGDKIASEREQWNDGSNTLCISPGKVVVYQRNIITNNILKNKGITVLEMPDSELSRGRGGPRCMSMPLIRQ